MEIILDCRELKLYKIMPDVKTEQLMIGDILIKRKKILEERVVSIKKITLKKPIVKEEEGAMSGIIPISDITPIPGIIPEIEDHCHALIERKTWSDLYSSILDGRYTEQKARMKSVINPDGTRPLLCYILEGKCAMHAKICKSACVSMALDNIALLYTDDIYDTKETILKIFEKISRHDNVPVKYETLIKPCKKDNMTAQICFIQQLSCIPGLSGIIATELSAKWKNMKELITEIELHNDKNLINVKINNRRISKTVVQRLIDYLLQN